MLNLLLYKDRRKISVFVTCDCVIDVPALENLSFIRCKNTLYFDITAPKLRSLTIKSGSSNELGKFLPVSLDLRSISTLVLGGCVQVNSVAIECMDAMLEFHAVAQTNKMLLALKFVSFKGSQSEMLFIKELLASFSTFKEVVIVRDKYHCKKDYTGIMQELLDLPVASTKTKIIIV
nr:F-box/FBD/LRR-repeat protein At1g13570-like isoform X1 [Ipomoea batatas]